MRLGEILKDARLQAGLTLPAVMAHCDWSVTKITRIENGENAPSIPDVRAMLNLYGVNDEARVNEILEMARKLRRTPKSTSLVVTASVRTTTRDEALKVQRLIKDAIPSDYSPSITIREELKRDPDW